MNPETHLKRDLVLQTDPMILNSLQTSGKTGVSFISFCYFQCLSASAILCTIGYDALVWTENVIHSYLNFPQACNIIGKSAVKFLLLYLTSSQKEADNFITQFKNPTYIHLERYVLLLLFLSITESQT